MDRPGKCYELRASLQIWPNPRTTPHITSIKKPPSQRYESLKGVDPKFPRDTCFAKKHNGKGPREAQGGQDQDPKGWKPQALSTCLLRSPKLGKRACAHIARDLRVCRPKSKAKAHTELQAASVTVAAAQAQAQAQAPEGAVCL
ncbi:PREDICTED: 60S ribosomal protein L29-like [Myotis brandtii]|uniref:60S ribosomal protein L29-like n=1 Tax=Myotis brandtii TaxID=109478 RepID=UPI0003BBF38D|nr:PREDICTED: 60S ribosomal protein L29-like [Myotis brandtii]